MYISPLIRMKKVHIWIGTFSKTQDEYEMYFNQENPPSQFGVDINIEEYDEDLIGIIPLLGENVEVKYLLNEVPIEEDEIPIALSKCENMKIREGNAVFYLTDSLIKIDDEEKKYNELKYIGVYNSSL